MALIRFERESSLVILDLENPLQNRLNDALMAELS